MFANNRRSKKGQSMVEYALGIGCIAATCLVAFQGIGMESADIVRQVILSVNDQNDQQYQQNDPGATPLVKASATPWKPQ